MSSWLSGHHGHNKHRGRHCCHCHDFIVVLVVMVFMVVMVIMVFMVIMVIRTNRKTRTTRTNKTDRTDRSGHLNLNFQVTCVGPLSQFLRCFVPLFKQQGWYVTFQFVSCKSFHKSMCVNNWKVYCSCNVPKGELIWRVSLFSKYFYSLSIFILGWFEIYQKYMTSYYVAATQWRVWPKK